MRGIQTSIPFFTAILRDPDFVEGAYSTGFLSADRMDRLTTSIRNDEVSLLAAAIAQFEADTRPARPSAAGKSTSPWKLSGRVKR